MAEPDIQRKLSAIMFTDIVGYTKMMGLDETATLGFLNFHDHLLRMEIAQNGGVVIKTVGDAFLADFSSAVNAVRCAVSIQRRFEEHNRATGEKRQLRIGIHIGDVVVTNNDIFGDGVNIASRLESIAEPGTILVSEDVYHHIKNMSEVRTLFAGSKELKNVDRKVRVYRVVAAHKGKPLPIPSQTWKTVLFFLCFALGAWIVGICMSPRGQEWMGELPFSLKIWGFTLGAPPPTPVPTQAPTPTALPVFTATATATSTSTATATPTATPKPPVRHPVVKKKPKAKPKKPRTQQDDGIEANEVDEADDKDSLADTAPTPTSEPMAPPAAPNDLPSPP